MPQLSGELAFMPCRDLFLYLGNRRLAGKLAARRGRTEKSIELIGGAAVSAASNEPREYLGQVLINSGHLTEDEFNRAYRTQLETKVPLGRILTMIGLVEEDVVKFALLAKIRETALDICTWNAGSFTFEVAQPAVADSGGIVIPIPLFDLCREAEIREPLWREIRELLPTGQTRLALGPARTPPYAKTSLEGRLLPLVEEGRAVEELLLHLHATDFQLYQLIVGLVRQGVLQVLPPATVSPAAPAAPVSPVSPVAPEAPEAQAAQGAPSLHAVRPPPPPAEALASEPSAAGAPAEEWFPEEPAGGPKIDRRSAAELAALARESLAAGRVEEAEQLASRAVEKDATADALEALREAEAGLLLRLRDEYLAVARIPVVEVDLARVKAMPLTPPERYLLARMDGGRDLGSIVRVSPLREVDALKLVKKFVEQKLVRLR